MKPHFILILVFSFTINLNAQNSIYTQNTTVSNNLLIDTSLLLGRWHQKEVVLTLDSSNGISSVAEKLLKESKESQKKIKTQILTGELAIVTQFNFDGTFTHEVFYANPKIRFPAWREVGRWTWNPQSKTLSRKAENMELTTLELSTVKKLSQTELVLEVAFLEGESKGIIETIYLKRFVEPRINVN